MGSWPNPEVLSVWVAAGLTMALTAYQAIRSGLLRSKIPQLRDAKTWIVDVRSPAEYLTAPGETGTHIPLERLEEKTVDLDRNTPIVLCCKSGERSEKGMEILRRKGFRNVANAGACEKIGGRAQGLW